MWDMRRSRSLKTLGFLVGVPEVTPKVLSQRSHPKGHTDLVTPAEGGGEDGTGEGVGAAAAAAAAAVAPAVAAARTPVAVVAKGAEMAVAAAWWGKARCTGWRRLGEAYARAQARARAFAGV